MNKTQNPLKIYVEVNVDYKADGSIIPRSLTLDDDGHYTIDKVLDVRPAASLKAGGAGMRYRVRIGKQELYLFLE